MHQVFTQTYILWLYHKHEYVEYHCYCMLIAMISYEHHIVQNGGRVKLWRIGNFKNLAEKTWQIAINYPCHLRLKHTTDMPH